MELATLWRSCRTRNLPMDTDNTRTAFEVNFLHRWLIQFWNVTVLVEFNLMEIVIPVKFSKGTHKWTLMIFQILLDWAGLLHRWLILFLTYRLFLHIFICRLRGNGRPQGFSYPERPDSFKQMQKKQIDEQYSALWEHSNCLFLI